MIDSYTTIVVTNYSFMQNLRPIGVFDSGIGGLTVLKEILRVLPNEHYIYIGDTAHVPYGEKSHEEIIYHATNITKRLLRNNVKAIIVACNTISAVAIHEIKRLAGSIPVIDVITPTIEYVSQMKHDGDIAVLATPATVQTHIYKRLLEHATNRQVIECSTPLFVPLIERHSHDEKKIQSAIEVSLKDLKRNPRLDTVILGCTHYPLIATHIEEFFDHRIHLVNPALPTAEKVKIILLEKNLYANQQQTITISFTGKNFKESFEFSQHYLKTDRIRMMQQITSFSRLSN
ncbi:MAG: glutamate racemase [Patescibacteria group bacterium]|nr:glutamate racemase [Patescibacteria group bacterium]